MLWIARAIIVKARNHDKMKPTYDINFANNVFYANMNTKTHIPKSTSYKWIIQNTSANQNRKNYEKSQYEIILVENC